MSLPDKPIPVKDDNKKRGSIATLKVDRDLCIGAASCVVIYPEIFQLDQENKAVIQKKDNTATSDTTSVTELKVDHIDDDMLLLAAQSCPTLAIFLYDENGNQVFPQ